METSIEIITPDKAKEYLKHNTKNRNINRNKVAEYAREMREGRWKLNGETISFDKDNALNDGQHRLHACIKANVSFMCVVVRGTDTDVMDTIDCGKARTASDVLKINCVPSAARKAAATRKYLRLSDGNTAIGDNKGKSGDSAGVTNSMVWECYQANKEIIDNAVLEASKYYDASRLLTVSDIAGIMIFLHLKRGHTFSFVAKFFSQLCDYETTSTNVIRQLRRILQDDKMRRLKMTSAVRQAYVVKTWNYYAQGKDVKILVLNPKYDYGKQFI